MKPGRELDALIAEKVMGWKQAHYFRERERWVSPDKTDPYRLDKTLPKYSTDIAAAWEVVEKIRASKFNWNSGEGYWDGEQTPTELGLEISIDEQIKLRLMDMHWNTHVITEADTLPHAICLAALKAVGSGIPE